MAEVKTKERPVVELLRTHSGRYAVAVDDYVHGPDDWPYTTVASWPLDERIVLTTKQPAPQTQPRCQVELHMPRISDMKMCAGPCGHPAEGWCRPNDGPAIPACKTNEHPGRDVGSRIGALTEKLREVRLEVGRLAIAQEKLEEEPVEGSRRLGRLRRCYTDLGAVIGHLTAEEEQGDA